MGKRTFRGRVVAGALGAGVLLASATTPASAGVDDNKTFTVAVSGVGGAPTYAGDADSLLEITITNTTSSSQQIGSVNVTLPSSLRLLEVLSGPADSVPGGPTLELRELAIAPNNSRNVTIKVDVRTCVSTTATISATAKQSNDYSGQGNDFFPNPNTATRAITGPCALVFFDQPQDAEVGAAIRSTTTPSVPISVEVRDAGNTGRATHSNASVTLGSALGTIGGTTTAVAQNGLASFVPGPTLSVSASVHHLSASSSGLTSGLSAGFAIVDDLVSCAGGQGCNGSAAKNGTILTAEFDGDGGAANLLLSIGAADAPFFECPEYPRGPSTQVSQFEFTADASDRIGSITATIPNATKPLNSYQVCWAAPYAFTNKAGNVTVPTPGLLKPGTGTALHVGLLPDCPKRIPADYVNPCILSRTYIKSSKTVSINVRATGEDPWRY